MFYFTPASKRLSVLMPRKSDIACGSPCSLKSIVFCFPHLLLCLIVPGFLVIYGLFPGFCWVAVCQMQLASSPRFSLLKNHLISCTVSGCGYPGGRIVARSGGRHGRGRPGVQRGERTCSIFFDTQGMRVSTLSGT